MDDAAKSATLEELYQAYFDALVKYIKLFHNGTHEDMVAARNAKDDAVTAYLDTVWATAEHQAWSEMNNDTE